jgi:glycosyltransferase involved in cell wall biosynthesis
LNACDVSLVTIARGIEGISFPSKLYSSLAIGKPVVAISESGSELKSMVEQAGAGLWTEVGDVDGLEQAIRRLRGDESLRRTMGHAARASFESRFTSARAAEQYLAAIDLAASACHS